MHIEQNSFAEASTLILDIINVKASATSSALVLRKSGQLYPILGKLCGLFPLRDRVPWQNNSHSAAGHTAVDQIYQEKHARSILFVK